MGKPSDDDALSLHTQRGGGGSGSSNQNLLDDDAPELQVDDLPPLYDEIDQPGGGESTGSHAPLLPSVLPNAEGVVSPYYTDTDSGIDAYLAEPLDNDPKFLEQRIYEWAAKPPRVSVRLNGTHTQTIHKDGKKERQTVTDFDVYVDITPFLFSNVANRSSWRELNTAENTDKVCRGTVFRKRAPGARRGIELGLPEKPSLEEWCHRYCASHSGLKSFTLERRVTGFEFPLIKEKLEALVRNTNYHGRLSISLPIKDRYVHVYNDCRTNHWRMNKWICWLFYLTFLWIFTWPYLFFRTKKFEVVYSDWPFSVRTDESNSRRFVSISEDQWYNMWGRAIYRAVLEKRQCTLDQQDLMSLETPNPVYGNSVVDGAMNFLRAGAEAMNEVNRTIGWGYDT